MNTAPTCPIFVVEGFDVLAFSSLDQAENKLETIDVRNNVYRAFDAEGHLLDLQITTNRVAIILAEEKPNHVAELELVLRNYLKSLGHEAGSDPKCLLPCLVRESTAYACAPYMLNPLERLQKLGLAIKYGLLRYLRK
ncbi:MAG: hypothetical protein AB9866_04805 [Syntrophobacteraceae bacterium]